MTEPANLSSTAPGNVGRSILAVFAGFLLVFVLSLGTDQVLHMLRVYPPWSQPMRDNGLNALALSYRLAYGVIGSYVMAMLAPRNPMRHVWVGAGIGFVLSCIGAVGAITMDLGPAWYPVTLAVSAWVTGWIGGKLYMRRAAGPQQGAMEVD